MAKGRIVVVNADGSGAIREKAQLVPFEVGAPAGDYHPEVGDQVSFEKQQGRALRLWPQGSAAPPSAGHERPEPPVGVGQQRPGVPRPPDGPHGGAGSNPVRRTARGADGGRPQAAASARRSPVPPAEADAFVNPYNFVPLHGPRVDRCPPEPERHRRLCGPLVRFEMSLAFETPGSVSPVRRRGDLATKDGIPALWVRRDGDRPTIPGASLKGALRTVMEILSGSCLSQFDTDTTFSWRPIEPSKAGFLERRPDGWVVVPAIDIR
ncbi:MAG: hypothetical protein ACRDZ8_00175, partial [Acidimicrobiales bacterium]